MRLTIRTKLLAGFAAVIAVMVGSMGYAIYALNSLDSDATTIAKSDLPSSGLVHDIKVVRDGLQLEGRAVCPQQRSQGPGRRRPGPEAGSEVIAGDFAKYRAQYAIDAKDRALLASSQAKWEALLGKLAHVGPLVEAGKVNEGIAVLAATVDQYESLQGTLEKWSVANDESAAVHAEGAKSTFQTSERMLIGLVVLAALVAAGIGFFLARRIAGGLKPVQAGMNSLADNCLAGATRRSPRWPTRVTSRSRSCRSRAGRGERQRRDRPARRHVQHDARGAQSHSGLQHDAQKRVEFADVVSRSPTATSRRRSTSRRTRTGSGRRSPMLDSLRDIARRRGLISHGDVSSRSRRSPRRTRSARPSPRCRVPAGDGRGRRADRRPRPLANVELRSERDALGIAFNRMTENVSAVLPRSRPRRTA